MPHPIRSLVVIGALALTVGLAGCSGSSGGSDGASSTTKAERTTTTAEVTTTTGEATTTTSPGDDTTTTASGPTTTLAEGEAVDCQALLQEYADVFDPDDLAKAVVFFRQYEPAMPDDVAAATERIAVAYEKAGDLGHMDLADVDLTADSQAFTDWTNDGCPAG